MALVHPPFREETITALSDLIARLEVAKEGSAALDALIQPLDPTDNRKLVIPPKYTRSLDAALTLVPTDLLLRLYWDGTIACITLRPKRAPDYDDVEAPTIPLALCIATLKAREAAR